MLHMYMCMHMYMYEAAPDAPWAVMAGGRWVDEVTLEMAWVFVQTAFRDTVTCHFQRASRTATHTVHILRRVNINSHRLPNHTSLEGVAEPALSWSSSLVLISAWLTVAGLGRCASLCSFLGHAQTIAPCLRAPWCRAERVRLMAN